MKAPALIISFAFFIAPVSRAFCQEAPLSINLAEQAYASQDYGRAAHLYERIERFHVLRFYKVPQDVPGKLASCYLHLKAYGDAARWYKRITDQAPVRPEDWIGYGDVLKCLGRYEDAKAAYRHTPDSILTKIQDRVNGCDSAEAWLSTPSPFRLSNLASVNTGGSDWGAVAYNRHAIVFTSDSARSGMPGRYQKVYVLDSSPEGGDSVKGFTPVMNSNAYHDGSVSFSRGGDTAYFSITNPGRLRDPGERVRYRQGIRIYTISYRRLEIWWTAKDSNGTWKPAQPFPYNNSRKYSVGQAALDPSGRILYFTSDMPGGYGKTDIWYSERQPDGSWSAPVNCGPQVNTAEEEAFPYISSEGALYFASKGHAGMGGFDVFSAQGEKNSWARASNMKYPINSSGDDFFYTLSDSLSGFVSSDRPGGKGGDDIYTFTRPPVVPPVPAPDLASAKPDSLTGTTTLAVPNGSAQPGGGVASPRIIILKTRVLDKLTGQPLEGALVTLSPPGTGTGTDAAGLAYMVLAPDVRFVDSAGKDGFIGDGDTVSTVGITGPDTLSTTLHLLKKPSAGDVFVLHNVYFDFNKWNIREDATAALDRVVEYMKQYPTMTIDLSSHTDSRGDDAYNMALSIRRARSARRYMLHHGIALKRISIHGYGETRPVNGCRNGVPCSEEEHQANRRVEIKIIHQ